MKVHAGSCACAHDRPGLRSGPCVATHYRAVAPDRVLVCTTR